WQIATVVGEIPAFLLPSPFAIFDELITFLPAITSVTIVTGGNALIGLVVGALFGIVFALLAAFVRVVDSLLAPLVAAIAVVPIVALAPILYSMFGANSELSRQIIAAIAVFIPVFANTLRGLGQTLPVQRDLMRAYAATPWQIARAVTIPSALPFLFTGLRIASSLAVISALIAEYFGGPRTGIGSFITTAASGSNYSRAWAYVLGAILLGLIFYGVTLALETYFSRHRRR
ncbi:MAG TPA: ABC transporter permease subunit, partial [Glaciihabitans sp.]|nr:ABC transporter permease subunit [Glaciihabitans sp.]